MVILKTFEELHEYIKRKNLTNDFGGALEHDYRAWLAVQKVHFECVEDKSLWPFARCEIILRHFTDRCEIFLNRSPLDFHEACD